MSPVVHFSYGTPQAYVRELAKVKKESLDQAGVKIVVIGCGGPDVIDMYARKYIKILP